MNAAAIVFLVAQLVMIPIDKPQPDRFGADPTQQGTVWHWEIVYQDPVTLETWHDLIETPVPVLELPTPVGTPFTIRYRIDAGEWSPGMRFIRTHPADVNRDGRVGLPDYSDLTKAWGFGLE